MVRRKHILFIVENNSVPKDIRVWSEALTAKECGYEVTVISPKGRKSTLKYEKMDGIDIYRHPMPVEAAGKFGFVFEYLNAFFWELLLSVCIFVKKPFQIIHSANPPDHIFLIALLFKIFGTNYVFDHHDISPENYLAKFGRKDIFYKILLLMEKLTFKTADIVISTNESYKKIAIGRGNKQKDDVFVVRNGPDLSRVIFMPPNDELKDGFDHLVAYVGVIGKEESIDNLLSSVDYIVNGKGIQNIKFVIVGTGTCWEEMVDLSLKMGLSRYVCFTGYIPYKEFYEILSTADVCVNPEFANAFTDKSTMVKIMDYMVFGKPIVQFDVTEGRVTAGESAIYVEKNDVIEFAEAIIDLLNDSEKRRKIGEIGRKRIIEKLNWENQRLNLERAYKYLEYLPPETAVVK
jgi:glycosyltransferase involved in cell wall biosynthesis